MRKTITVVAALVVLAVIGVGASRYLNQGTDSPAPHTTEQAARETVQRVTRVDPQIALSAA